MDAAPRDGSPIMARFAPDGWEKVRWTSERSHPGGGMVGEGWEAIDDHQPVEDPDGWLPCCTTCHGGGKVDDELMTAKPEGRWTTCPDCEGTGCG